MKTENQPHANKFLFSKKCGAKTRKGTTCKSPAMKNGRCRMHGGKSPGPPKGNQNAFKHGFYTRESILNRKFVRQLMRNSKDLINVKI